MEIDRAIENLKAMLSELRKEDIDDIDEQEPNIDRQEFYNETTPIYFNTDKTTIIFALTKKLRQDIIEELKKNKTNIDTIIHDPKTDNKYNGKYNIILIFGNDILTTQTVTQLNLIKENAIQKEKQIELFNSTLIELTSTNFNEYKNIQEVAKVICKKVSICIEADYVYIGKNDSESIININTYNRNTNKDYIGLDFKKNAYPDYVKLLDKKLYFFLNHIDKSNIVPQSILEEFSSVKSALNIPIKINNNLWGVIGFAFNSSFHWQNELISFCKSVGDIFGAIAATFYIKDNKQKLENVLDSLNETIWGVKLPEFKLEYISSSALTLYEYPLEDWFKNVSLWSEIIHPEDKVEALKKSDLLYVNDVIEQDYRIITGNNKVKWISTVTRIIRDKQGIPILMTGISKDITAIKESQLELLNYKQAINESAIVSTTDLKGNITFANDKFCQISGYTKEELIGSNHSIVNSGYHAKDFFKTMWKTISEGKVWRGEIKNRAKNGNEYYVDTNIIPFIQNGKPISYISIRYECTDRVNAREV
jgi:PAS domain S-box-containing protein